MIIRPSAFLNSAPSEVEKATGTIPEIVENAVISTGRKRNLPAVIIASYADRPSGLTWLA